MVSAKRGNLQGGVSPLPFPAGRPASHARPARASLLLQRLHPAVERGPVDAEELGRLADVATGELHRRLDVALLPCLQHAIQVEAALALQVRLRLLDERVRIAWGTELRRGLGGHVELGLELLVREPLSRVLR